MPEKQRQQNVFCTIQEFLTRLVRYMMVQQQWTGWSKSKRSEEHTSELQSHHDLVCRLLLEKKKQKKKNKKTNKKKKKQHKTKTTCAAIESE